MPIVLFVERPVQILRKSQTTLLDSMLKIGGLLGFLRLFMFLMGKYHQ